MRFEDLEIINQLEDKIDDLDKERSHPYAKTNIKAAMNAISDSNYRFACERLAIAIAHILSEIRGKESGENESIAH